MREAIRDADYDGNRTLHPAAVKIGTDHPKQNETHSEHKTLSDACYIDEIVRTYM